jgi:hypothetical protein
MRLFEKKKNFDFKIHVDWDYIGPVRKKVSTFNTKFIQIPSVILKIKFTDRHRVPIIHTFFIKFAKMNHRLCII